MKNDTLRIPVLPHTLAKLAKRAAAKGMSVVTLAAETLADSPMPKRRALKKKPA